MNDIVGIATRSKAALEPVVELYSRLTVVGRDVGLSQARISRLTETASKAATISGGTPQARDGALVQFSQAVGANFQGSGQEFQSLAEGAPILLKSIADGFKNADGSIGTTVANLRKLGQEGKLSTLQVADALDRVASKIDAQSSKIEARISTAGTAVRNAFVIDIGKFDQAVGFSNTLAQALTLVAENMRTVLTLGVGIAGAFAGIKLVNFGKDLATQASGFISTQRQVAALDAAWLEEAAAAKAASAAAVSGLEAQRLEIGRTVLALQALTQEQAASVVAAESKLARNPSGKGQLFAQADLARANEELRYTTNQLVRAQEEQRGVVSKLGPAYQAASQATERHGAVVLETGKRTGIFKSAASGLVSFLGGPWGIAFGIATAALTYLATAESNAERATRLHENAQRDFASILDATTGKIYTQVTALEVLSKKKTVTESLNANLDTFKDARSRLALSIGTIGANPKDPQQVKDAATLHDLARRLQPGAANAPTLQELSRVLTPLAEKYKGLSQVPEQFTKLREAVERSNKDAAALRIGTAAERPTDVAVVTGRLTDAQARSQPIKTKTQLDREAAAAANSGSGDVRKQAAGRRDTALLDLEGRFPKGGATAEDQKQYLAARQQILATYDSEIKGITDAKHAASVAARDARHNRSRGEEGSGRPRTRADPDRQGRRSIEARNRADGS